MTTKEIKLLMVLLETGPSELAAAIEESKGDVSAALNGLRKYPHIRRKIETRLCRLLKERLFDNRFEDSVRPVPVTG